jgi:hypothetical protein
MPRKPREIESTLVNKLGFSRATGHSSDHRWYELQLPGLELILTKVSHSRNDIGSKLEGMIARQCRVRRQFFEGMMDCTKTREEYYHQVREDPFPPGMRF